MCHITGSIYSYKRSFKVGWIHFFLLFYLFLYPYPHIRMCVQWMMCVCIYVKPQFSWAQSIYFMADKMHFCSYVCVIITKEIDVQCKKIYEKRHKRGMKNIQKTCTCRLWAHEVYCLQKIDFIFSFSYKKMHKVSITHVYSSIKLISYNIPFLLSIFWIINQRKVAKYTLCWFNMLWYSSSE